MVTTSLVQKKIQIAQVLKGIVSAPSAAPTMGMMVEGCKMNRNMLMVGGQNEKLLRLRLALGGSAQYEGRGWIQSSEDEAKLSQELAKISQEWKINFTNSNGRYRKIRGDVNENPYMRISDYASFMKEEMEEMYARLQEIQRKNASFNQTSFKQKLGRDVTNDEAADWLMVRHIDQIPQLIKLKHLIEELDELVQVLGVFAEQKNQSRFVISTRDIATLVDNVQIYHQESDKFYQGSYQNPNLEYTYESFNRIQIWNINMDERPYRQRAAFTKQLQERLETDLSKGYNASSKLKRQQFGSFCKQFEFITNEHSKNLALDVATSVKKFSQQLSQCNTQIDEETESIIKQCFLLEEEERVRSDFIYNEEDEDEVNEVFQKEVITANGFTTSRRNGYLLRKNFNFSELEEVQTVVGGSLLNLKVRQLGLPNHEASDWLSM